MGSKLHRCTCYKKRSIHTCRDCTDAERQTNPPHSMLTFGKFQKIKYLGIGTGNPEFHFWGFSLVRWNKNSFTTWNMTPVNSVAEQPINFHSTTQSLYEIKWLQPNTCIETWKHLNPKRRLLPKSHGNTVICQRNQCAFVSPGHSGNHECSPRTSAPLVNLLQGGDNMHDRPKECELSLR